MTIDSALQSLVLVLAACLLLLVWTGWRLVRGSGGLRFYSLRRQRQAAGWRLIASGILLGLAAVVVQAFGRQVVYTIIPPTPSTTPTPTITLTPTLTRTPTITSTPEASATPTETGTPSIPEAMLVTFHETVTLGTAAALSPIVIASRLDNFNRPLDGAATFARPPDRLLGAFTYDGLVDGVRWTALWWRGAVLVCRESKPWDGGTGGYGYTECTPDGGWVPGEYEVQMFLGEAWWTSTRFTVEGVATTPSP
jgi:hypothetical protein